MQVQINMGHNIQGHEALVARFTDVLERALERFSDRITLVEAHLSDENGRKGGPDDKRCMIEARLEGYQPLAVTEHAAALDKALDGAAKKLVALIEHTLGRLRDQSGRGASRPRPEPVDQE